jgi:hypothetical protein
MGIGCVVCARVCWCVDWVRSGVSRRMDGRMGIPTSLVPPGCTEARKEGSGYLGTGFEVAYFVAA